MGEGAAPRRSNELHTLVSSVRFKQDVRDMGESSELLMKLRPVTFRYREEFVDGENIRQYGLIAEEVAEVAPALVAHDAEGRPYTVHYDVLSSLLLNEMQKQQHVIDEQGDGLGRQRERLGRQREQIAALAKRLEELESRVGTDREGANR